MKLTIPKRRLAILQSLVLGLGILVVPTAAAVLAAPQAAQAAVTAGDVVFERSLSTGYLQINVRHASDGSVTNLYETGSYTTNLMPDVSADGGRIAFIAERAPDYQQTIYVMNADGSALMRLTGPKATGTPSYYDANPRWSPDGQWILFTRTVDGYYKVMKIRSDGSDANAPTTLVSDTSNVKDVATWSPNGARIAYTRYESSRNQVWIVDADGGNDHRVTSSLGSYDDSWPVWSPDGSRIYVTSDDARDTGSCSGSGLLYFGSSDGFSYSGTGPTWGTVTRNDLATTCNGMYWHPRVSANGSTVYFDSNAFSGTGDGSVQLVTVSSSGGTPTKVMSDAYTDFYPTPVKTSWAMKTLAVLGDSFSAGEGNPPFISGTDTSTDKCHRSDQAYAHILDSHPTGLSLLEDMFIACSLATSIQMDETFNTEPSQVDTLGGLTTAPDVVVLTVGGNDVMFKQFATACVDPLLTCDGSSQYDDTVGAIEYALPDNLDSFFGKVADAVGTNTRVLVLGYPWILPLSSNTGLSCSYLTSGERAAATNVQIDIDGAIHSAVTRAGAPFEYVDANATGSPFAGHELCSSATYFNGLVLPPGHTEYSFHPNEEGQSAYAKLVTDYLAANPS